MKLNAWMRNCSVCRSVTWKFWNSERSVLKYAGPLMYPCRETLRAHRERISAWQKCWVTEEPGIVRRAFFHEVRSFVLHRNLAPGTAAPLASRTLPANELVYVCAAVKLGSSTRHTITTTTAHHHERQIEDTLGITPPKRFPCCKEMRGFLLEISETK
jgi:hypothetical protein